MHLFGTRTKKKEEESSLSVSSVSLLERGVAREGREEEDEQKSVDARRWISRKKKHKRE